MQSEESYIVGYTVKDFEYSTPTIVIDKHGIAQISYADDLVRVGTVTLLQKHKKMNGKLIAVDPIHAANTFILYRYSATLRLEKR